MTTPRLALATSMGRLYRRPEIDEGSLPAAIEQALTEGLLVPSVTNVIDVFNKPFLQTWYAKRAAEDAIDVVKNHPGLIEQKPYKALTYIKGAAERTSKAAADLGDEVHNTVEALARGESVTISPRTRGYVDAWHRFVEDFRPEFLHLEATCYGVVPSETGDLGYAGTADFIARINGLTVVGDYKTGRSIHTEAALQLSALAHATRITNADETGLLDMPTIDGGVVLHLTASGYKLLAVDTFGPAWDAFMQARRAWDFHQANLSSRGPLFFGPALSGPDQLSFPSGTSTPATSR